MPNAILLVGFDDISPAHQILFDAIEKKCKLAYYQTDQQNISIKRLEISNQEEEIRTMARWAKQQQADNKKIACVIPNLTENREQVLSIFTDIFAAENIIPGHEKKALAFDISAGEKLSSFLMIQHALTILNAYRQKINIEVISQLLLSPYIAGTTEERCLAAMTDVACRETEYSALSTQKIIALLLQEDISSKKNALPSRFKNFFKLQQVYTAKKPLAAWAKTFHAMLCTIGWPGSRTLNSQEYQVCSRWHQLLEEFASLDRILRPQSKKEACKIITDLCQQTVFQVQSEKKAIQILGVLEASGHAFDALWLMGLDNETWPARAKPNPFLPMSLQRGKNMPHASASRELTYTQTMQNKLIQSATQVLVSSAMQNKDKPLQASQLIIDFDTIDVNELDLADYQPIMDKLYSSHCIEKFDDSIGPDVKNHEKIMGGSWILQQQSTCPFRAFSAIRLKATPFGKASIGISAKERGIITHHALEHFWAEIKTQTTLLSKTEMECDHLIETCIETALHSTLLDTTPFFEIERTRLKQLLYDWLTLEKQRPPFKVLAQEKKRHISIGQLTLQIQIDRIDELENGQQLIIDYKTGSKNNLYDWFGDRPRQIQLPLYCVYGATKSAGLSYGIVSTGNTAFKGIMDDKTKYGFSKIIPLKKLKNENWQWEEINQHWQNTLEKLSKEFCQGEASVDPVDHQACAFCDFHSLCRIGAHHEE